MPEKFNYKSRKIWLDTASSQIYYTKPTGKQQGIIKFDSVAEYNFYTKLKQVLPQDCLLLTQTPLWFDNVRWCVDFKIIADSDESIETLTAIWERYNISNDYSKVITEGDFFIEYKGVRDKNFMDKQAKLSQCHNKDRLLLLTTPNGDAFYMDSKQNYNPYVKLMPSVNKLIEELSNGFNMARLRKREQKSKKYSQSLQP